MFYLHHPGIYGAFSLVLIFFLLRVVVLDKVTDFVLFLSQLTIVAGLGEYCVRCCDFSVRNDFGKASEVLH